MELILLQTKALLLGPSISGANGMLLKDICREALKEESCHSATLWAGAIIATLLALLSF